MNLPEVFSHDRKQVDLPFHEQALIPAPARARLATASRRTGEWLVCEQ